MVKQGGSIDLVSRKLQIEVAKGEYKRIRLVLIALVLGLTLMSFNFFVISETTEFFNNENTQYYIVLWFLLFIGYEFGAFIIAGKYLKNKSLIPKYLTVTNAVTEAIFPGLLLFILCWIEQSVIFLDSPLLFIYFILIVLSTLNLEIKLSLITGVTSALGYLIITLWAINTFDAENNILHFPPILYIARSIIMMITALGATFVTYEIKSRQKRIFSSNQQKQELELLFGQQVSKKVAKALVNENSSGKKEVSILFMDIRNFTKYAEKHTPEEVIEYQNGVFSPILRIIEQHHGVTNQILGDGIMATFGAPEPDEEHVYHAFDAGLKILQKVYELSNTGKIPPTKVGIGLHCGNVIAGNIGNETRKQFSISGTAVIIAARLEQANKQFNTEFLISDRVYQEVNGQDVNFRSLGKMEAKNIEEQIDVYSVNI